MKKLRVSVFLVLFYHMTAHAFTFIGNGGEGALMPDNRLYTLELFQLGYLTSSAKTTGKIDLAIATVLQSVFAESPVVTDESLALLTKRLSDVEALHPGLGIVMAHTTHLLNFVIHDKGPSNIIEKEHQNIPIVTSVDELGNIVLGTRVQIAIRRGSVVEINDHYYRRLDAENQVALILHELLYSLLTCTNRTICMQDFSDASVLTRFVLTSGSIGVKKLKKEQLESIGFIESAHSNLRINFVFGGLNVDGELREIRQSLKVPLHLVAFLPSHLDAQDICKKYRESRLENGLIKITANRLPFFVVLEPISSQENISYLSPTLKSREPDIEFSHVITSSSVCESVIKSILDFTSIWQSL